MKKYFSKFLIIIFLLILQLVIPVIFPSLNLVPDFILIYLVISAIISGEKNIMFIAAFGGLLQDLFINSFLGLFSPIKTAVVFLATILSGRFFPENIIIPPLGVFMATIIQEMLYLLLKENYLFVADYSKLILEIILPLAALNALIAFVVYLIYLFWGRSDLSGQT